MGVSVSLLLCIVSAYLLLTTDIARSEDRGTDHQPNVIRSHQVDENGYGMGPLEEQNDDVESPMPSIYEELYPESDEYDIFDDEEEASYCS